MKMKISRKVLVLFLWVVHGPVCAQENLGLADTGPLVEETPVAAPVGEPEERPVAAPVGEPGETPVDTGTLSPLVEAQVERPLDTPIVDTGVETPVVPAPVDTIDGTPFVEAPAGPESTGFVDEVLVPFFGGGGVTSIMSLGTAIDPVSAPLGAGQDTGLAPGIDSNPEPLMADLSRMDGPEGEPVGPTFETATEDGNEEVQQVVDGRTTPTEPASKEQLAALKDRTQNVIDSINCSNTHITGSWWHLPSTVSHLLSSEGQSSAVRRAVIQSVCSQVDDGKGGKVWQSGVTHDQLIAAGNHVWKETFGIIPGRMGNCSEMAAALYTKIIDDSKNFDGWSVSHAVGTGHAWLEMTDPSGQRYLVDPWNGNSEPKRVTRQGNTLLDENGKALTGWYKGQSAVNVPRKVKNPIRNDAALGRQA